MVVLMASKMAGLKEHMWDVLLVDLLVAQTVCLMACMKVGYWVSLKVGCLAVQLDSYLVDSLELRPESSWDGYWVVTLVDLWGSSLVVYLVRHLVALTVLC